LDQVLDQDSRIENRSDQKHGLDRDPARLSSDSGYHSTGTIDRSTEKTPMPRPRRDPSDSSGSRRPRPAGPGPAGPRSAAASREEAASVPRIIGGELRGRRLEFVPDARTRPMKDRVRESLFDLIGTDVRRAITLDLFAGSGAIGFEALSRGAERVIFVERHFPTADTLRRSGRSLGVEDRIDVRSGDVLLWARRMPAVPATARWLVFVSPPWSFFSERTAELMALVDALLRAAPAGSTIVVEADTAFDPAALPDPGGWETRPIPPAVLHLHRRPVSPAGGSVPGEPAPGGTPEKR
jgi:16S rRNA (guanine966-N2)-methyltransferase